MTLKITINMDNAAFEDNSDEAIDILEALTLLLERRGAICQGATPDAGQIMDSNGNTVGKWSVTL